MMRAWPEVTPPRALAAALAVALALAALPQSWLMPVRGWALAALQPGQRAAGSLVDLGGRVRRRITSHVADAGELAAARDRLERLTAENRRLAERVETYQHRIAVAEANRSAADRPWLKLGGIQAHTLGCQARSYLARRELLDVGSLDGVEPGALVLDGVAVIDRGERNGVRSGHLVVDAGCVWGRVAHAGPNIAIVRTLTAPGFRDVVRLRSPGGPEGILEGDGGPLCRIRMVAVTEPAAAGDEVFAASLAGLDAPPARYGVIERVEQPVGAAHWEIWMRPALTGTPPEEVIVVKVEP